MQGPPYRLNAASAFTIRSAPTSRGLSVWIDRPVRVPGSTTTAGKLKYRVTMSRSAVVEPGTTDEMTTPVISFENERPVWSRSPANSTASSSAVRSVSVDRRHWCSSSGPRNTPSTVFVFPTFTASSTRRHLPDRPSCHAGMRPDIRPGRWSSGRGSRSVSISRTPPKRAATSARARPSIVGTSSNVSSSTTAT